MPLSEDTRALVAGLPLHLQHPHAGVIVVQHLPLRGLHNDDTGMRVLKMEREPGDKRTGVFTSSMVSPPRRGRTVFHGAGIIADVLKQRAAESGPAIQMSDALSWNAPKLPDGVETLVAHCLAHGRAPDVIVSQNFPVECRHVLEQLGEVYGTMLRRAMPGSARQERLRFSSAARRADYRRAAGLAGGAVWRAERGAELESGEGDHVSTGTGRV